VIQSGCVVQTQH